MLKHLDKMSDQMKESLSEDCEDFLLHRHIPLRSHSAEDIITQAMREGYQIDKFDRFINKPPGQ